MAWDITQPTNTTKIRNLGIVIRPNWQAIEEGDSTFKPQAFNLTDRTVAGLPVNPTAIADAIVVYCKESTAGNSEFYVIDENSNVIQLSESGRIGGPAQNFNLNNLRFGTRAQDYTINNVVHAYGRFTSNGSTVVANNCNISRVGTGLYQITLSIPASNTNFVPVAVAFDEGNSRCCKISVVNTSTFRIHIVNGDGDSRDCGGFFHVVGGF